MNILFLCIADNGGIAEYSVRQVNALTEAGAKVTLLCRSTLHIERIRNATVRAVLPAPPNRVPGRACRIVRQIVDQRTVARITEQEAVAESYDALLIACYSEYFSPFWANIFRRIALKLPIGTIAHDPVRDYVVGPLWWHRWSIRQAYSFISDVFVHDNTPVDFGGPCPDGIKIHIIPHGPFEVSQTIKRREDIRQDMGFTENEQVFLSFGQIRDGKNLDRFLRALPELPDHVKLLVAGSSGGGSLRQPEEYQQMARDLGVAQRCVWDIRYIPDEETGNFFAAADFVLMTYSAKFRSASGVMNTAVACRKPVLASSGPGPLKTVVEKYHLGIFISPDDDKAILDGTRSLIANAQNPDWERYERENSWQENANAILAAFTR
jgi:glycosyltransferase involved in cell wall biosynthesis